MMKKAVLALLAFSLVLPIVYADIGPKQTFVITNPNIPYLLFFMIAAMLTIMIEVAYAASRIKKSQNYNRILYSVVAANIISLPVIWFVVPLVLPNSPWNEVVLGEILIVVLEALLIYALNKNDFTLKTIWPLVVVMNLLSVGYGAIIGFFTILLGLFVADFFFSLIFVSMLPTLYFLTMKKNNVWAMVAILVAILFVSECVIFLSFSQPYKHANYSSCKDQASACAMRVDAGATGAACLEDCMAACSRGAGEDVVAWGVMVDKTSCTWQGPLGAATGCSNCAHGITYGW